MGIKGLTKLLNELAEDAMKPQEFKNYFGRKIAIDASMCLYQFLIAIRSDGPGGMLTDANGEPTAHLNGIFYRTIRMLENGLKPVYVFDGKAPDMKGGELEKRRKMRDQNMAALEEAKKNDNAELIAKFEKRTTRAKREHSEEAKKLLRMMGVPVVESPGEAEAQCAELCKGGLVYATATEDMDALTFGTPRLVRHMLNSKAKMKVVPIREFDLSKCLTGLDMSMGEFIDMCILCGCDYTNTIRGIGPKKAYNFLKEHKSIEAVVEAVKDIKRYVVPADEDFQYKKARGLFIEPLVTKSKDCDLKWGPPDTEAIIQFMVEEKGFSQQRIENGIARMKKAKNKGSQKRLDCFFGASVTKSSKKRKRPDTKGKKGAKGKRTKK